MLIVPLQAKPAQQVQLQLANQTCQIRVYQAPTAVFIDLSVNNSLIIGGVICENRNRIVRDAYLGFIGDLAFVDQQGNNDPEYTGLGARYLLFYLTTQDLNGLA